MKDSFQLNNAAAVIYPVLFFIVIMIPCLPKVRCVNTDGLKFQFVRRKKKRTEDMAEETRSSSVSRTFIDCPLFPCIEFVSETTSYHSGSDWYIPSEDSMVDVVINETTYSVPLSLMTPNYTAWKWERERRKMIRAMGDNFQLKRSASLPCISDLWPTTNQHKLHSSRKCMQTTALAKSPFIIKSKLASEHLKEKVLVDVSECHELREDLKDSNHSYNVNPNKALMYKYLSSKNLRENFKLKMDEESQCCMEHPSYTCIQDIEKHHNMRMNQDLMALECATNITDIKEHTKSPEKGSQWKIDNDFKASYKCMPLFKMESDPKIPEKCDVLALHSLSTKYMMSKPGASYHRSADSLNAKHVPLRKGDRANSMSLKMDEQPFQKHPYSPFTCLKNQTEIFPTCDCGFSLKQFSSNSSKVGTISENEATYIVMEDEVEIYPSLLQETSSGLYLNPSSTSRIVEEGKEDEFTVMEIGLNSSCENEYYSKLDDKTCTKMEID